MKLIDVKPSDRLWDEMWKLYEESFPKKECRLEDNHRQTMTDPEFNTQIAVDENDNLLGLLFYWDNPGFIYVEHFAINPALRGLNIGSTLLSAFVEANEGRGVILEIDPPKDEISIRRLHFYERQKFVVNGYQFIHPGFVNSSVAQPHQLVLMSYMDKITPQEYSVFKKYIVERVLAQKD